MSKHLIKRFKRLLTLFLVAVISAGISSSKRHPYHRFYMDDLVPIYTEAADTEHTAYPMEDLSDTGVTYTYTYTYINYKDRITSAIYSNSPLSEYLASQFVNHAEEFSLSKYPEVLDSTVLLDAVCEAYYQNNAYIGGIELNQIKCNFNTKIIGNN